MGCPDLEGATFERLFSKKFAPCFLPGSNRRPCPCEGHVITTTLRKHLEVTIYLSGLALFSLWKGCEDG